MFVFPMPRCDKPLAGILLIFFMALSGLSCSARPIEAGERYEYRQLHLGVQVRIVLYTPKEATAREAARAAFKRIAALEDVFSDYRPTSEARRLAGSPVATPVRVSSELFEVMGAALEMSRRTSGAFDVTAGPLVSLWRAARRENRLPDAAAIDEARVRVGWEAIRMDPILQTITLEKEGMGIDFGGIAKGFILDEALATLDSHGVDRAMLEAGGDLVVSGPPPGKKGWEVRVPGAPADFSRLAASLTHAAIASSGDTEQYLEVDGIRYSHVVDPRTGQALTHRRMATVIAPRGITADAWATALTVLGNVEGPALAREVPGLRVFVRVASDQAPVR